jgi:[acyl-carrier-protein] S-malonyltransferase
MKESATAFSAILKAEFFSKPIIPIYFNVTGDEMDIDSSDDDFSRKVSDILTLQLKSPVLWQKTIENLVAAGAEAIIELGPGKTLTGLDKKIAPDIPSLHVEDAKSLHNTVETIMRLCATEGTGGVKISG